MSNSSIAHAALDPGRMIVLPLKPRFAEAILAGAKTVELRRSEPKIVVPTRALIYATSPVRALVGTCIVTSVVSERLAALWREFGPRTGINHQEFLNYFEGVEKGTALTLADPASLPQPIPLTRLRETSPGFRPPQSFAYVDTRTGDELLRLAA
ncbi:MAG: ASCH domain-containing protein [Acidimicrobiaceae bacterium]|nr:ASCH domain-containing protein [Acidimicrobiaceae bacterium]